MKNNWLNIAYTFVFWFGLLLVIFLFTLLSVCILT